MTPDYDDQSLFRAWKSPSGFAGVSAVNQTPIGKRYLITGLCFFVLGGIMALIMRTQLAVPENDLIDHELYNQLFSMHGTTMLFLFAVPILEGAALFLIPPMIGARDMAFPRLSAFGYWCYLFGGVFLYASILFDIMPNAGWSLYTPLSNSEFSPRDNIDYWLLGITMVETGAVLAAAEIAVSILKNRAPGMSLNRMPLFAWYMLVVSFMILFGFPPLIMGDLLLELERSFHWPFFDSSSGGHSLLWQHLFWIFGHPEVYIIFLPAAGFVSMIIATFSQRPAVGYYWLVVAAIGTGFVSFGLWVHHMFVTGIPLISLGWFSSASMTVSIFSGIQIFAWIATLWLGKPKLTTPMLFVIGFIILFVAGGLSGVMHAVVPVDWQLHSTYFLIAHFHYVLFGGMVFPLFGAIYYWFPLASGKLMSERLGKWNFWLLFIGFNITFFPMHISGLEGMPRRIYTYPEGMWEWENMVATVGAYMVAAAVLLFLFNLVRSLRSGAPAGVNPWNAGTLEWATTLPTPAYNFRSIPQVESPYPLWDQQGLHRTIERSDGYLPEPIGGLRLGVSTHAVTGDVESVIVQPKPDYAPLAAAVSYLVTLIGMLIKWYWLCGLGTAGFIAALAVWLWRQPYISEAIQDRIQHEARVPPSGAAMHSFGWWGTVIAVLGDAALFVSLIFAYFYLWTVAPSWPPAATAPFDTTLSALGISVILAGSAILYVVRARLPTNKVPLSVGLMGVAAMAVGFALIQAWVLADSGLSPRAHAYNALVFTLVGFNLLHVGAAILMLIFSIAQVLAGPSILIRDQVIQNTSLVWHYVALMSIVTSLLVHFWPGSL